MKTIYSFLALMLVTVHVMGQNIIFMHHSTGENVFNEGKVSNWFINYNSTNGTNYNVNEMNYPDSPYEWANYPYDYWNLWINNACDNSKNNIMCLDKVTQSYDVIILKHCFPGADIEADETLASVSSSVKTLANYKLQYRALRTLMDNYPNNKFIIWTLAPLHRLETNSEKAARAKEFVTWVKNLWLTEDGKSHPNIHIFDFYSIVAELGANPANGKTNCLKYIYERSHTDSDSHPNTAANQAVGPQFAQTIVNVIKSATIVQTKQESAVQVNYSNHNLSINGLIETDFPVIVELISTNGRVLYKQNLSDATESVIIKPGSYIVSIKNSKIGVLCKKLIVTE